MGVRRWYSSAGSPGTAYVIMYYAMRCPNCGKRSVISHVTVRWNQANGVYQPARGHYCIACKTAFEDAHLPKKDFAFRSVRVSAMTDALRRLQESADLVVVRHRTGEREVLF